MPENGPDNKKQSLGRANAAKFVERLCKYPGDQRVIAEGQRDILETHAERLTLELEAVRAGGIKPTWVEDFKFTGERVTVEDIEAGRAPRPRVLDMFAGGGAIPLEALRLGCEAYALDLNPVAHLIELCTLVYPQKYGKPDPNARGMTGPKNVKGETTWGGLAGEVRYWGEWVLRKVKAEIGDLYPLVTDPEFKGKREEKPLDLFQTDKDDDLSARDSQARVMPGYLVPVAYLWTRTVKCKNPSCGATVPLLRQTWLCKKKSRFVAMKMVPDHKEKRVRFEVVEATSENGLGFDPEAGSRGGNATCRFCGTVADSHYVKAEGCSGRISQQLMTIVCKKPGNKGKIYLSADKAPNATPDEASIRKRMAALSTRTGLTVPNEPIITDAKNSCWTHLYGLGTFGDLFTPRQMLCLLTFATAMRDAGKKMQDLALRREALQAVLVVLASSVDKLAALNCSLTRWKIDAELCVDAFGRQALPMVWDFAEQVAYSGIGGSWQSQVARSIEGLNDCWKITNTAIVIRGSATASPWPDAFMDAVITDPPYYDNVPYADISDFFYVWLKRTVGYLYPEHFATAGTPKKQEAVADAMRHGGSKEKAQRAYEEMMAQSFREAHRVLKPGGALVVVYAHKTTLGWSTLVDALRQAGFVVAEAWPLDTEMKSRLRGMESAALASSIFLVARKRNGQEKGQYETDVRPELERIVRERVSTLWEMGVSGADLVIACVGAGLRAFTRFARVEYANGEPVPAVRFLSEVESVVLDQILARLSKEVGGNGGRHSLAGVDPATQFYILWRYTYRTAELDAGEAIVFANGTHVELDGQGSLAYGPRALVEKKKGKYRLRDFRERGEEDKLGLPVDNGSPAPLIDALHRTLWLLRNSSFDLPDFLRKSGVNREQMRLVAQALAGPALKGGELGEISPTGELSALSEITANWRSVIEDVTLMPLEREARRTGQKILDFEKEKKK
jgi:putative DNA methylase